MAEELSSSLRPKSQLLLLLLLLRELLLLAQQVLLPMQLRLGGTGGLGILLLLRVVVSRESRRMSGRMVGAADPGEDEDAFLVLQAASSLRQPVALGTTRVVMLLPAASGQGLMALTRGWRSSNNGR